MNETMAPVPQAQAAEEPPSLAPHHVFLIDGSGFIFRAYHALPPLTRSDGTPTGAVLGFSNMLAKLLSETDADHIAVVFDASGTSFRNRLYSAYKAQRPDAPADLVPQFKLVRHATKAFGVCQIELDDFEADDLIATYARHAVAAGAEVTVVSSDKDLMQLVGAHVRMLDPIRNRPIGESEVREKFGVGPDKVVEVQALCGDSVDNVPGVKGISVETAAQLINGFNDLETLLIRVQETDIFHKYVSDKADDLAEKIFHIAGKTFNIASVKQLGEILFEGLKISGGKKGKTNNYAVGYEVLKELANRGFDIASLVIEWRLYSKLAGSLADSLREQSQQARLSKELVRLDDDAPLPCPLSALRVAPPDPDRLLPFLREMEFRGLAARMAQRLSGAPAAPAERPEPVIPEIPPFSAPHTYMLVETEEALKHWIAMAEETGFVALWAEASARPGRRPELCGLALAVAPGRAAYVPLAHRAAGEAPTLPLRGSLPPPQAEEGQDGGLSPAAAIARLKPLFEAPGVLKIGHDMKTAAGLLLRHGILPAPWDCTMLMSYVLDGGQFEHGIENLTRRHFTHDLVPLKELIGTGKSLIPFAEVSLERARDFAAERADAALRLSLLLKARLVREHRVAFYETIERPLVPVVAAMEDRGIKVDRAALAELSRDFAQRIAALEEAIYAAVGSRFNIGSTKQLGDVLFEKLGLPGGKKGKTGAYGTDAATLEQLSPLHEAPRLVLDWRQLSKLKSTYADALAEEIDSDTGRVHTSYALASTVTGRFSSLEPNLQNIPVRTEEGRRIRRAFIAEPGHVLLSADYSQIELRLAAHVADIPELKAAFREGLDIHALTASQVFGVPIAGMDPLTRRRAKAINFGIIYGISPFGLGQQIGVPPAEAAAYIHAYLDRFPAIRAYMERIKTECRRTGTVETIFGRKCFIPGIRDQNPARRAGAERQAINAPLQGSAADIIRRAMARIPEALASAGLTGRMLLQVHDELLFEVPEAEAEATARVAKAVMEGACVPHCELSVPLVVETNWAADWDAAH